MARTSGYKSAGRLVVFHLLRIQWSEFLAVFPHGESNMGGNYGIFFFSENSREIMKAVSCISNYTTRHLLFHRYKVFQRVILIVFNCFVFAWNLQSFRNYLTYRYYRVLCRIMSGLIYIITARSRHRCITERGREQRRSRETAENLRYD